MRIIRVAQDCFGDSSSRGGCVGGQRGRMRGTQQGMDNNDEGLWTESEPRQSSPVSHYGSASTL